MDCCNILETLSTPNLLIKRFKYWSLYLRSRTKTLGTSALITNVHYARMSDIPQEAFTEFSIITKQYEKVLDKLFGPDKYNYQMNMMKESHTHFNIFPRYSKEIKYNDFVWIDSGWPALPGENIEVDKNVLEDLAKELRAQF